jgi:hypothetical protein
MRDEHFSRETAEQFFRSELPKAETMLFVRHLLRQCPACGRVLRQVTQRRNFRLVLLRGDDAGRTPGLWQDQSVARPRTVAGPWRMIRRA